MTRDLGLLVKLSCSQTRASFPTAISTYISIVGCAINRRCQLRALRQSLFR